jgi:hypothetical protein
MKTYNGIASNRRQAEQAAGEFFKTNFSHSGRVGEERSFSTQCDCGESLAIEYYSKDDPGMSDTFTAVICESCYDNADRTEKV